jgi:hypothetical protein
VSATRKQEEPVVRRGHGYVETAIAVAQDQIVNMAGVPHRPDLGNNISPYSPQVLYVHFLVSQRPDAISPYYCCFQIIGRINGNQIIPTDVVGSN